MDEAESDLSDVGLDLARVVAAKLNFFARIPSHSVNVRTLAERIAVSNGNIDSLQFSLERGAVTVIPVVSKLGITIAYSA